MNDDRPRWSDHDDTRPPIEGAPDDTRPLPRQDDQPPGAEADQAPSPWAQGPSFDDVSARAGQPPWTPVPPAAPAGWTSPHQPGWPGERPPAQTPQGHGGPPQYQQPQYGQPQYGQPQYGQAPYGQPQYGQPQYGQPQYGQPQYGQAPYGQPGSGQPQYGPPTGQPYRAGLDGQSGPRPQLYGTPYAPQGYNSPPPTKRRGRGIVVLTSLVALMILGAMAWSFMKGGADQAAQPRPTISVPTPTAPTNQGTSAAPSGQAPTTGSPATQPTSARPTGARPTGDAVVAKNVAGQQMPTRIGPWEARDPGAISTDMETYYRQGAAMVLVVYVKDPAYGAKRFDNLQGATQLGNAICGLNPGNEMSYCYYATNDGTMYFFGSTPTVAQVAEVANGVADALT